MMKRLIVCLFVISLSLLISAPGLNAAEKVSGESGEKALKNGEDVVAIIETKFGEIVVEFFPDRAPGHVDNFIKLARKGFYDGTIFHRVIPGFMIQGGDPNTKGDDKSGYGRGGPGYTIDAEFNDTPHKRGILSMARSMNPNSAGSQFFIVVKDSTFLDGKYTVFGRVISGMDVADKVVSLPRRLRGPNKDLPNERVEMKIRIVDAAEYEKGGSTKDK